MSVSSLRFSAAAAAVLLCLGGCSSPKIRPVAEGSRPMLPGPEVVSDRELAASDTPKGAAADNPSAEPAEGAASDKVAVNAEPTAEPTAGPAGDEGAAAAEVPAADRSVSWPQEVDGVADYPIGAIAGRAVTLSELVAKWVWREPARVRAILDDIVLSRIIAYEAAALQIEPPEGAIEAALSRRLDRLEAEARNAGRASIEEYITEVYGMDVKTFGRQANEEAIIDLLASRCVRSWLLASDHREIRAITVATKDDVAEVQARLAKGEAFEDVARELSVDSSKEDGGRLPPVVRGADQLLTRTAFAAEVGTVTGPVKSGEELLFVKVEAAPKPLEGLWPEIGEAVEKSLELRDIEDPEFWQWKAEMLRKYDVNMDPFLKLMR